MTTVGRGKRPGKRGGTYFERAARVEYFQGNKPKPDALPIGQPLPSEIRAQIDALRARVATPSPSTPLERLAPAALAELEQRTARTLGRLDLPTETRTQIDALRAGGASTARSALAVAELERRTLESEREAREQASAPQSIAELVGTLRPTKRARRARRPVETHVERARRAGRPPRVKTKARIAFEAQIARDAPGCSPRAFERWVYAITQPCMSDASGRTVERAVEQCRREGFPGAARALRAAHGFSRRRPISSFRTRAILTLWIVIARSSRHTDRRGFWKKTEGYTCKQLRALFTSPVTGEIPSRGCFDAQSWGADRTSEDDCGYLTALERAGCFRVQQPSTRPDASGYRPDPRYVGRVCFHDAAGNPRRCAFAVFWIYGHAGPPEPPPQ